MENIDDVKLSLTKFRANSAKYFSLFDKHIPRFENEGEGRKILMLGLSNEGMMLKCCALNKKAKYFVVDQAILSETLPLLGSEYDFSFFDYDLDLYDIIKDCDMKFDCIIMNPPYKADLHLKILAETLNHLKDENSVCVNLSPVRWLQDVVAHKSIRSHFVKYNDSVAKHLITVDVISAKNAIELFEGGASADLGIYVANNQMHKIPDIKNHYADFILTKVVYDAMDNANIAKHLTKDISSEYFVCIPESHGHTGAKDWCDIISPVKKYSRNKSSGTHASYVLFSSEESAENFRLSLCTKFMRCLNLYVKMNMSNRANCYPWLGDAINPRTGKKGYESEWTDDDFYKFFNITKDEQKIIEETMEKYK